MLLYFLVCAPAGHVWSWYLYAHQQLLRRNIIMHRRYRIRIQSSQITSWFNPLHRLTHMILSHARSRVFHRTPPPHFALKARQTSFSVCTIDLYRNTVLLGRFIKLSGKKWRRRYRRHTLFHYWSRFCLFPRKGKEWSYPVSVCVCVCSYICVCVRACVRVYFAYSSTNVSESIVIKHFIQAAVHHTFRN